ncbi:hypothetical protein Agub_g15118 [Astrephomene gubernaculifera]|uniref:Major facilitator superfamily (MFS) profile domain-containing protein n=1 Tax=Astrephomene gubernaculifera TaxID=47775 RepID=A0AAD3E333_9CHLO|nr:hypothetical protein Agub_g15118 [Astrephomene gubernaculifera]
MSLQLPCSSASGCSIKSGLPRCRSQTASCSLQQVSYWPQRSAVLSGYNIVALGRRRAGLGDLLTAHGRHGHHGEGRTVRITRPRRVIRRPDPSSGGVVAVPVDTTSGSANGNTHVNSGAHHDAVSGNANASGAASTTSRSPVWAWWDDMPSRYKIIFGTAVSFVICNLDKVNLSVCIIPMARDYGWSPTTVGLVQSAFFWGYMLCQLPGGYFNSRLGGRRILPAGALLYSAATAVVPWVAATIPGLCLSRAVVGFGQATAPSAATDIVARAVPPSERARAVTFTFSGFHVGSILGLMAAPWLIAHAGWHSVFISFGALGGVWWLWFEQGIMADIEQREPEFAARLISDSRTLSSTSSSASSSTPPTSPPSSSPAAAAAPSSASVPTAAPSPPPLPWRAFLRSTPVRALAFTHFANNWFHYTMLAWLPTYFVDTLSVDLLHASQTALLPPLAGIAAGAAAGAAADAAISRGVPVPRVRKVVQNTAFLLPTALLLAACTPAVGDDSGATVAAITVALGVSSGSLAGLFCTHQDMSPKYASILLGLTNTTAAIPGVLGVAAVGYLFEHTQSWEAALFLPSAFFMVTAALAYTVWGRNDPIDFDAADNSPFGWETRLQAVRQALGCLPAAGALKHLPGSPEDGGRGSSSSSSGGGVGSSSGKTVSGRSSRGGEQQGGGKEK